MNKWQALALFSAGLAALAGLWCLLLLVPAESDSVHVGNARLYASYLPTNVLRVTVSVGNPSSWVYALVDPTLSEIVLAGVFASDTAYNSFDSTTFLAFGTASPVFMRVRTTPNAAEASAMALNDARAIIGVGPGSPVYAHWNCVTLSPSVVHFATGNRQTGACTDDCGARGGTLVSCDSARISFLTGDARQPLCILNKTQLFVPGDSLVLTPSDYAGLVTTHRVFDATAGVISIGPFRFDPSTYLDANRPRKEPLFVASAGVPEEDGNGLSIRAVTGYHFTFNARARSLCYRRVVTRLDVTQSDAVLAVIICVVLLACWLFSDAQHVAGFTQTTQDPVPPLTCFAAAGTFVVCLVAVTMTLTDTALLGVIRDRHNGVAGLVFVHVAQAIAGGLVAGIWATYVTYKRYTLPLHLVSMLIEGAMWSSLVLVQFQQCQGSAISLAISLPLIVFTVVWARHAALHLLVCARLFNAEHYPASQAAVSAVVVLYTCAHVVLLVVYVFVPMTEAFVTLRAASRYCVGVVLALLLACQAISSSTATFTLVAPIIKARFDATQQDLSASKSVAAWLRVTYCQAVHMLRLAEQTRVSCAI